MTVQFHAILSRLTNADVRFVVIGGVALALRGSPRTTIDVDICYARDRANLERLAEALRDTRPHLRGAPADLPFMWDAKTLATGLNFTLTTDLGDLDLLGEVPGLGAFESVARHATPMDLGNLLCEVLTLNGLERAKRAAGRIKDLADLAEIAEIRRQTGEPFQ